MELFPTTVVLDDFNRADSGPPPSASWNNDMRFEGAGNQGLAVRSNAARGPTPGGLKSATAYWNTVFRDDNEAYVTLGALSPPSHVSCQVWARGSNLGTAKAAAYVVALEESGNISLLRYDDIGGIGYNFLPGTSTVNYPLTTGDKVGIRCIGNTVEAWARKAGVWARVLSCTSSVHPNGGQIGLYSYDGSRAFDDFGGGSIEVFPYAGVLDNFNRANAALDGTANWRRDMRSAGAEDLWVQSNACSAITVGDGGEASDWWEAKTFRSDCEAYVRVPQVKSDFEIWARGSDLSGGLPQAYVVWYRYIDATHGEVRLQRYGPGGSGWWVNISDPVSFTLADGDSLGIRVKGSTITAFGKHGAGSWEALVAATDTAMPTGGQIGLLTYNDPFTFTVFDDFGGGSLPGEVTAGGSIAPASSQTKKTTKTTPFGAALGVTGLLLKTKPLSMGGAINSAALGGTLAKALTLAPVVVPLTKYRAGMDEMLFASLPWPEAQVQLAAPGVEGQQITASCGWHGSSFDPWRGSFAIVSRTGPLAEMVGERLAVSRRDLPTARTVYVYVHADSDDLTEDMSLTRRAFMDLGDPALDNLTVVCDVVGPSVHV
jgi:hypothetical protein